MPALFLIGMCLIFLTAFPAYAGNISILPIPQNISKMQGDDFLAALIMAKHAGNSKLATSLWTWEKLEPDKGRNETSKELAGLNYIAKEHGLIPYIGLTAIDTVKRTLPRDLNKKAWDDPQLILRYAQELDLIKSELVRQPAYFIIANEADVYFYKHVDEFPAFLKFAEAARLEIRKRFPQAAIGISATYEGLHKKGQRRQIVLDLIKFSDFAFYTYYPVMDLIPTPPSETPAHLDEMISAAYPKKIILQEIGYPSALQGSSPEIQADFFRIIIPEIMKRGEILESSVFALHDFDEDFCNYLTKYYGFGGLQKLNPVVSGFKSFLCSLGLRNADGTSKPAWETLTAATGNGAAQ